MPNEPKRHHQVPNSYLLRFALNKQVRVRRRDGKAFDSNTLNVAVESGFYDAPDPAGGKGRIETLLASIDSAAAEALAWVDRTGQPPAEYSDERFPLAVFIAFQMTRTTEARERIMFPTRVADWLGDRPLTKPLIAEYLEIVHLGFKPTDSEAEGAWIYVHQWLTNATEPPHEFAIRMMLDQTEALVPRINAFNWTIELDRKESLITSDTPVVIWRTPGRRDDYEGIGVDNAEELRFPLDPGKQLVLSRRRRTPTARITPERVRACNADMAAASHRFVVGRPDRRVGLDGLRLDEWRPVVRFNTGPLFVYGPGGKKVREGEALQMWVPRRSGVGRPRR
jgi:Protein of unknown function (DUF4238)